MINVYLFLIIATSRSLFINFRAKEYNDTSFEEWEKKGAAPAVPAVLFLYKKLVSLGFKIVFISGKTATLRAITEKNLKNVGYLTWEKLILK
jgi:predicted secreted acid phosphatase